MDKMLARIEGEKVEFSAMAPAGCSDPGIRLIG
jgi:hypothetical protein